MNFNRVPSQQMKSSSIYDGFHLAKNPEIGSFHFQEILTVEIAHFGNSECAVKGDASSSFPVNETQIVKDRTNVEGLLVKRFDRLPARTGEASVTIHQEDAFNFPGRDR
jgi:hypothetical protein